MKPELLSTNIEYWHKILNWKKINYELVGRLVKVEGFSEYNKLIDINSVFSNYPFGEIVDRTNQTQSPFKYKILRPWVKPKFSYTFAQFVENRVEEITSHNRKINICWSGGIDSTCMLVGFLLHAPHEQLRVIYSPYAIYENSEFFELLKKFPKVELLDISGSVYIETDFDGIFVNGHCGDEFVSSLDESFYEKLGPNVVQPWQDYFSDKNVDMDFCESFFSRSQKPIETLLDARWWFYASCKSQVFQVADNLFLANQTNNRVEDTLGFYDSFEFESFMYFNPELIMDDPTNYKTHKMFMKKYIYSFDKNIEYLQNKEKTNSRQFAIYTHKKLVMLDKRWIAKLSDSSIISTNNLPLFSEIEFKNKYGTSLDYLFNEPNYV